MATLSVQNPTLLDLAKATDPDGGIADIVEILAETNEVLDDMTWVEGNLTTGNRTSIRTGLPTPTWRKMYGGVQPDKGSQAQVDDTTGMLEAYAEVDKALADLSNNTAAFRQVEERAHLEGLNQEVVDTLFYGNEDSEPEAFTGLSPRFNSTTAANGENIISGGGSGSDNASISFVGRLRPASASSRKVQLLGCNARIWARSPLKMLPMVPTVVACRRTVLTIAGMLASVSATGVM